MSVLSSVSVAGVCATSPSTNPTSVYPKRIRLTALKVQCALPAAAAVPSVPSQAARVEKMKQLYTGADVDGLSQWVKKNTVARMAKKPHAKNDATRGNFSQFLSPSAAAVPASHQPIGMKAKAVRPRLVTAGHSIMNG